MKKFLQRVFLFTIFLSGITINAQNVGINATGIAPGTGAGLDVNFTNKGVLIPRVALTNVTAFAPVVGVATTSLLVYNTNAAVAGGTGVGYYYWGGAAWIRISSGGDDWKIIGNSNTTQGTNFLGTTNATGLDFRTGNTIRMRLQNSYQLGANGNGTTGAPFYSWISDPDIGMWRSTTNRLNFSTAGSERLELGTTEAVVNDISLDYNFRVESNGNANMLFVDGGTNRVAIGKAAPTQALDVQGNVRFSGALMPNNQAGVTNKTLLSQGAGLPPIWSGFTFLNTPAIANVGKYYSTISWTGTWGSGTTLTFTINDPNMVCNITNASVVFVSFDCTNTNNTMSYFAIRNIKVNAGNMAITVQNMAGWGWGAGGLPITYVAFY